MVVAHFGWVPRADLSPGTRPGTASPAASVLSDTAGEVYTL